MSTATAQADNTSGATAGSRAAGTGGAASTSGAAATSRARIHGTAASTSAGSGLSLRNPALGPPALIVNWSVPATSGARAGRIPIPPGNAVVLPGLLPLVVPGFPAALVVPL